MVQKKVPIGSIVGAAAGIVAGILIAPKSGKASRRDLKEKVTDIKAEASKKADASKKEAAARVEQVVSEVKLAADELKTVTDSITESFKEGYESEQVSDATIVERDKTSIKKKAPKA